MLVLSRKKNESIRIADSIEIKVLEVRGGRIRLGIAAPIDVCVMRHEMVFDGDESDELALPCSPDDDSAIARIGELFQNDTLCVSSAHDPSVRPR